MHSSVRLIPVVAALIVVNCSGGDRSTAPSPSTLAGTWTATRAEFVSASNSSVRVEAISQGASITLTFDAGGTFTQRTTTPGQATETTTGSWTAGTDVLTLRPTGMSGNIQFDMALSGSTLTLNGGHVLFDVNHDNQDEETILNLTLTRQ
jgi:Lipocalin-like domain